MSDSSQAPQRALSAPPASFLPSTPEEIEAAGWDAPDVVFVSGDAYIDHPSFAAAILGRWLSHHGFRVAILAQPDWKSAEPWRRFGRPRLFYAVSAGNMDSMINHYTANRKRRNQDAYSPGGRIGLRPDRATAVYSQRCREAFKGVPVVVGGVEASLRRIAHYDYWSDKLMPSMLVSSKADLLAHGMGERIILRIAQRLAAGEPIAALRDMRGIAYLLGRTESLPPASFDEHAGDGETVSLPSYEAVGESGRDFALMTRWLHRETNPRNARRLTQAHGDRTVVVNPPELPLEERELDALYALPYIRRSHPRYDEPVPAWQTIETSVQIMRGCFGGCSFCSITLHQGRTIQSRSQASVLAEVEQLAARPGFTGHISDLGGPTANMYRMRCTRPEVEAKCRRLSCVHPKVCKLLDTGHAPLVELMQKSRSVKGIDKVHVASGIRMDLARGEGAYLDELVKHHVGGHLKVAPEHTSERVLDKMKKPPQHTFEEFTERFREASQAAGKEQFLVPYFIASHPGSTAKDMIELAQYLKRQGHRPRQVQDFIPAPMDLATCMYFTGLDPETLEPVPVAKGQRARAEQRALLQFWKPESYFVVRDALRREGREDLIGSGPDCLIPARPPRGAGGRGDGAPAAGDRASGGYRQSARGRGAGRRAGRPRDAER